MNFFKKKGDIWWHGCASYAHGDSCQLCRPLSSPPRIVWSTWHFDLSFQLIHLHQFRSQGWGNWQEVRSVSPNLTDQFHSCHIFNPEICGLILQVNISFKHPSLYKLLNIVASLVEAERAVVENRSDGLRSLTVLKNSVHNLHS